MEICLLEFLIWRDFSVFFYVSMFDFDVKGFVIGFDVELVVIVNWFVVLGGLIIFCYVWVEVVFLGYVVLLGNVIVES